MTTSRAYQAGYESVAVKLAVSKSWVRQRAQTTLDKIPNDAAGRATVKRHLGASEDALAQLKPGKAHEKRDTLRKTLKSDLNGKLEDVASTASYSPWNRL